MVRLFLAAALSSALVSCGDDGAPVDGGVVDAGAADAGAADAGRPDAGPGDAGPPPPPPSPEPGRHDVTLTDTRRVVPSDGLPPEVTAMNSNNNLDVVVHDGRVYLAFRTAPDHFAGPETVIYVVSSEDELDWTYETELTLDTDLREPRFLSLGGSLFLYVSILGTDRFAFEPMGVSVVERAPDGTWTGLEPIASLDGYVAWRTRVERGAAYMTAYLGGEHIYRFDFEPLSVDLLTTADGRVWEPVDPDRPSVYTGGGSEADFAIGDDGTLFGVIRNEAGDDTGWGSEVCRAGAGDLAAWSCAIDPKKYDSPLMFWHDGEAYLVARRNVTETGFYDLMERDEPRLQQVIAYQSDYASQPKRCALWRYVQGEDRIAFLLDLPSSGDTCFPGAVRTGADDEVVIYNYSSDPEGPDLPWNRGQQGATFVYRHVLRFAPRP